MEALNRKMAILYVEDEQEARELIGASIADEYPEVTLYLATNGAEGLELFREHRPEVVLTDILMPVMDGLQMATEIVSIDADTELIALTAYSDTSFLLNAIEVGFSHYVLKPIDYDRLFAALAKSLSVVELRRRVKEQHEEIRQFAGVLERTVEERTRELRESQQALEKKNAKLRELTVSLKGARDRYWGLYNWSPLGYMSLDDQCFIREINITGARILGAKRVDLVGTCIERYLSEENMALLQQALQQCTQANATQTHLEIKLEGSKFLYVHLHCVPYKEEEKTRTLYRTAIVDITRMKEAEEKLRTSERILLGQARTAAIGEMLVNLAHHWRQPLNAIGLHLQEIGLLSEEGQLSADVLNSHVNEAMETLQHMSRTIDEFREFTEREREPVLFTIEEAVMKAVTLVEENFRSEGITIEKDLGAPMLCEGQPHEYIEVILNLLMNARDALRETPSEGKRIVVRTGQEEGKKVLSVFDNAGGVDETIMDKIFDPFFTTKKQGEGFGLGLYMSRTIVEKRIGGRLTARNTGSGAEFRIEV